MNHSTSPLDHLARSPLLRPHQTPDLQPPGSPLPVLPAAPAERALRPQRTLAIARPDEAARARCASLLTLQECDPAPGWVEPRFGAYPAHGPFGDAYRARRSELRRQLTGIGSQQELLEVAGRRCLPCGNNATRQAQAVGLSHEAWRLKAEIHAIDALAIAVAASQPAYPQDARAGAKVLKRKAREMQSRALELIEAARAGGAAAQEADARIAKPVLHGVGAAWDSYIHARNQQVSRLNEIRRQRRVLRNSRPGDKADRTSCELAQQEANARHAVRQMDQDSLLRHADRLAEQAWWLMDLANAQYQVAHDLLQRPKSESELPAAADAEGFQPLPPPPHLQTAPRERVLSVRDSSLPGAALSPALSLPEGTSPQSPPPPSAGH